MTDNIKMASELLLAAKQILAANYVYDPDHKKKPRGGSWHKTTKGWSNVKEKGKSDEDRPTSKGTASSKKDYDEMKKSIYADAKKVYFRGSRQSGGGQDWKVIENRADDIQKLNSSDLDEFADKVVDLTRAAYLPSSLMKIMTGNPNASPNLLNRFVREGYDDVVKSALSHPNADDSVRNTAVGIYGKKYINRLMSGNSSEQKKSPGSEGATSKKTAPSQKDYNRMKDTLFDNARKIYNDDDGGFDWSHIDNKKMRESIRNLSENDLDEFHQFLFDEEVGADVVPATIDYAMASNPNASHDLLSSLAMSEDNDVLKKVLTHPNADDEIRNITADLYGEDYVDKLMNS